MVILKMQNRSKSKGEWFDQKDSRGRIEARH